MKAKEKTTCKEVMDHICDTLGEDLDSPNCSSIKEHLEHCESCQKYYNSITETILIYKKYNVKVTTEIHAKLLNFLGLDDCE
jgi:predicted anti-sigma-YlaC factor YlaD